MAVILNLYLVNTLAKGGLIFHWIWFLLFQELLLPGPVCSLWLWRTNAMLRLLITSCRPSRSLQQRWTKHGNQATNWNVSHVCWLERDSNLRPPDWRAGALPTELSSPTLAVSLFCQYLCSGVPVRSHETIYCPLARDHAQVTIQPGNRQ